MTVPRPRTTRSIAAALALTAAAADAQPAAPAAPPVLPFQQSIAINPLAIPFGLFSAEYEVALATPGFAFGVGGSYVSQDHDRDSWVEAKGLYYPNEVTFRGFSIGVTAGVHSSSRHVVRDCFNAPCTETRRSQTAPTLGVLASYDWLLGRAERFRVGVGAGAKRILKDVGGSDPLEQVWPDGRFVIGVIF